MNHHEIYNSYFFFRLLPPLDEGLERKSTRQLLFSKKEPKKTRTNRLRDDKQEKGPHPARQKNVY